MELCKGYAYDIIEHFDLRNVDPSEVDDIVWAEVDPEQLAYPDPGAAVATHWHVRDILSRPEPCSECDGSGEIVHGVIMRGAYEGCWDADECGECRGTGEKR